MSLSLIQGYSSAEEENDQDTLHQFDFSDEDNDSDNDKNDTVSRHPTKYNPVVAPQTSPGSALPSAFDAFSEVSWPPRFLNNCVEDQSSMRDVVAHPRGHNRSLDKKDLPAALYSDQQTNSLEV